jgi:plasmid stabilization system protein ParE
MRVVYHPGVQKDVNQILSYYDNLSPDLTDGFWRELQRLITLIGEKPGRFHPATRGLRRVNLKRFPYHILFRQFPVTVRIITVRHNKRHPSVGMQRALSRRFLLLETRSHPISPTCFGHVQNKALSTRRVCRIDRAVR